MAITLDQHRENVRALHVQLRIALQNGEADDSPIVIATHAVLVNAQRALKAEEDRIIRAVSGIKG